MADPLFVIGDRLNIDQRARELEYVHKPFVRGGGNEEGNYAGTASVFSTPIALHPPE
jgi:hypothetical protein